MSTEEIARPVWTLITAVSLAVTSVWIAIRMPAAIMSFREIFEGFGADIGAPTRLVLAMPYAWWLFPALALPVLFWVVSRPQVTRAEYSRMKLALRVLILAIIVSYGLAAWAIYTPIFKLGEAV